MHSVFKISIALLLVSAGAGQAWVHKSASASELASMVSISKRCPALAIEARAGQASKFDAVALKDAYWRVQIVDAVGGALGKPANGCAARGSIA